MQLKYLLFVLVHVDFGADKKGLKKEVSMKQVDTLGKQYFLTHSTYLFLQMIWKTERYAEG